MLNKSYQSASLFFLHFPLFNVAQLFCTEFRFFSTRLEFENEKYTDAVHAVDILQMWTVQRERDVCKEKKSDNSIESLKRILIQREEKNRDFYMQVLWLRQK